MSSIRPDDRRGASRRRFAAAVGVVVLACACQTELPGGPPPLPPTWLRVQGGIATRDHDLDSDVRDGWSFGLVSGMDLTPEPVRLGMELDVNYSTHEVDLDGQGGHDGHLDVWRFAFGGRLAGDLIPYKLGAHLRGGYYYSSETDFGVDGVAADASGFYYGAGLDVWFEPLSTFGPFITVWERDDNGVTDVQIGLGASFHF